MRITIFTTLLVLTALPSITEAYFTTSQGAQIVDRTTSVFSITYEFGHPKRDLYLPIRTGRDVTDTKSVGYTLLEESEVATGFGHIDAAIVSDAKITADGWYFVPAGTKAEFTLYAALEYERQTEDLDVALQITSLPFFFGPNWSENGLSNGELSKYLTAEVDLDEDREEGSIGIAF